MNYAHQSTPAEIGLRNRVNKLDGMLYSIIETLELKIGKDEANFIITESESPRTKDITEFWKDYKHRATKTAKRWLNKLPKAELPALHLILNGKPLPANYSSDSVSDVRWKLHFLSRLEVTQLIEIITAPVKP